MHEWLQSELYERLSELYELLLFLSALLLSSTHPLQAELEELECTAPEEKPHMKL